MNFGSEEMKELLIKAYNDPSYEAEAMEELKQSVSDYTLYRIRRGYEANELRFGSKPLNTESITANEHDDVVSEVLCNVIVRLDRFIINIQKNDYNEAQRQAWLRIIVYRTIAKYFHQRSRSIGLHSAISIDDEKYWWIIYPGRDISRAQLEYTVRNTVKKACLAPSKPEKILAFLFNSIIFKEMNARKINGSAKETSAFMNGKKLFVLKEAMIYAVRRAYGVTLTKKDVRPLLEVLGDDKPTPKGNEICSVTPKHVTDWSNRMKTYMFKFKKEFLEEGGGDDVTNK